MSHQYLSWFKRGVDYPSGNKLTPHETILKLKSTLLTSGVEVHESVQIYDVTGRLLYTPIYADFDGEDKIPAMMHFIAVVEAEFGLTPDIYFSGNRGFHLFINIQVKHAYPHLLARKFMTIMLPKVDDESPWMFDDQMYASRHLLRSEGSIHFKSNLYKVRVTKEDIWNNTYKAKAKKQLISQPTLHTSPALDKFINSLGVIVDKEVKEMMDKYESIKSEVKGEAAPCIRTLIDQGPQPGSNNYILTLIARNMNSIGIGQEDAIAQVSSNPKWMTMGREIISVFKSTYKQPSRFGCKKVELLKRHCDQFCPFNELTIDIM